MPKKTQEKLQEILQENVELYEAVELGDFENELRRGEGEEDPVLDWRPASAGSRSLTPDLVRDFRSQGFSDEEILNMLTS